MRQVRQVSARLWLLRAPRVPPRLAAPFVITERFYSNAALDFFPASERFLRGEKAEVDSPPPSPAVDAATLETPPIVATNVIDIKSNTQLRKCIIDSKTSYYAALKSFNELRARGKKLSEPFYRSLLYKALCEGRYERVCEGYEEFLEDERRGEVNVRSRSPSTWPQLTYTRLQMVRFVLWAMLDAQQENKMEQFYESEVVGKQNVLGIHEADPFNFLLRIECTTKVMGMLDQGQRQRLETLLSIMDGFKLHTSYSSTHMLFRLIFHQPESFMNVSDKSVIEEDTEINTVMSVAEEVETFVSESTEEDAWVDSSLLVAQEEMVRLIVEYMERFPCALVLNPKRLSIAVSVAAAINQHEVAKQLLLHGATHHVPIDAGSFAHTVESAPDETSRLKIADLYMYAKEHELIYTTQDTDSSISNYLLLQAVLDGNFKYMMELLHEMQLYNNRASNRTVRELFTSIAQYRAQARNLQVGTTGGIVTHDSEKELAKCPTIMELFDKFPNAIPPTVHLFSQGILQSLLAGDLSVAMSIMRAALWEKDVTLRPEIYAQLLYPLLAGGQRGGDEYSDASVFDRLEVERCFDRQHPKNRNQLNSLIVNICQSNDDLSTLLVCLDRWQTQGHPPLSRRVVNRVFEVISKQIQRLQKKSAELTPGTAFIVDGVQLSYLAFLVRYRGIIMWDAWTIERAIVRARTSGLYGDVVSLLAEADSRGLKLNNTAYIVSLSVLEDVGEPTAVVACANKMKANGAWESAVIKDPEVQKLLNRASAKLETATDQELYVDSSNQK